MIITAYRPRELDLPELYAVYNEQIDPLDKTVRIRDGRSEKQFIEDVYYFISSQGRGYCVLESDGKYMCAMRFEPFRDGILISCLETRLSERRKGYAGDLLAVFLKNQKVPVYSHVAKGNRASRNLHVKCGFQIITDTAELLDGTVSSKYFTMVKAGIAK